MIDRLRFGDFDNPTWDEVQLKIPTNSSQPLALLMFVDSEYLINLSLKTTYISAPDLIFLADTNHKWTLDIPEIQNSILIKLYILRGYPPGTAS